MIHPFVPLLLTLASIFFASIAIYFAIRFFAYKRSFPLSHRFDFLWILTTFLVAFVASFVQPPLEGALNPNLITWLTFLACLLIFYLIIFVLGQFLIDYFLVSVLKIYISPPLRKVIDLFIFALAVIIAVQKIFNINPWAIYAPTSLLSLGIGIALKDAFQTLFAGVALSKIVRLGDWIQVGDREGEVIDINWARTVIKNWNGDYLFLPNSEIQKGSFLNYSYKNRQHRCRLDIGASYNDPPQKVKQILTQCAENAEGVLKNPLPEALLINYGDFAVNYALTFWVQDYSRWRNISAEVATRIWYAFKREKVEIPFPIRTVHLVQNEKETGHGSALEPMLAPIDLFKMLSVEERRYVADHLQKLVYLKGETIVRQGEQGSSFFLVSTGSLEVLREKKDGSLTKIVELCGGQFFGELSLLTGEPRSATVRALEDSELLKLEKQDFQEILGRHPALSENLAEVVTLRQSALVEIKDQIESAKSSTEKSAISKKIRNFFNLK